MRSNSIVALLAMLLGLLGHAPPAQAAKKVAVPFWSLGLGPQWGWAGWTPPEEQSLLGPSPGAAQRRQGVGMVADGLFVLPVHRRVGLGVEVVGSWNTTRAVGEGQTTEEFETLRYVDAMGTFMFVRTRTASGGGERVFARSFLSIGPSVASGSAVVSALEGVVGSPQHTTGVAARLGASCFHRRAHFTETSFLLGMGLIGRVHPYERADPSASFVGDALWSVGVDLTLGLQGGGATPSRKGGGKGKGHRRGGRRR